MSLSKLRWWSHEDLCVFKYMCVCINGLYQDGDRESVTVLSCLALGL